MAAVLWAGEGAVVSHDSAAGSWGIARWTADVVHITCERKLTSPPRGVKPHVSRLTKTEAGDLRRVPVTTPARTLLDLAATRTAEELLPLVDCAVLGGLVTPERLRWTLARHAGRRGCRTLAAVLALGTDGGRWTSALEREVGRALERSDLPPYCRELVVGNVRIDFAWPEARVGIEADGRRWHSSSADFARDRAKHNVLTAAGWRILRVTWQEIRDGPGKLVRETKRLLAE
ncbi:MAG: DUF559 domain-containing protein [Actinomycetota bacterium]|nr:DUF559 domain-containing protein [Actinomycetota bacterium]